MYIILIFFSIITIKTIKVLATCGIRKLLDFVFTQRELFWLDDILPGKNTKKPVAHQKEAHLGENASSADNFFKNLMTNKPENKPLNPKSVSDT
jgi:hypothetical protein